MASPVGHGLIAILATRFAPGDRTSLHRWFAFAFFAVIAADLDFLPGLLIGHPGRFHHGATHSIFAALLFGAVVGAAGGLVSLPRFRSGSAAALLYGSHLLLDLLTKDGGAPFGQPLLWPFTDAHFALSAPPLWNINHGPGRTMPEFVRAVLSVHNLFAVVRELIVLLPPIVCIWWFVDRSRPMRQSLVGRSSSVRSHCGSSSSVPFAD